MLVKRVLPGLQMLLVCLPLVPKTQLAYFEAKLRTIRGHGSKRQNSCAEYSNVSLDLKVAWRSGRCDCQLGDGRCQFRFRQRYISSRDAIELPLAGRRRAIGGVCRRFPARHLWSRKLARLAAAVLVGIGMGAESDAVPFLLTRHFGLGRFSEMYGYT